MGIRRWVLGRIVVQVMRDRVGQIICRVTLHRNRRSSGAPDRRPFPALICSPGGLLFLPGRGRRARAGPGCYLPYRHCRPHRGPGPRQPPPVRASMAPLSARGRRRHRRPAPTGLMDHHRPGHGRRRRAAGRRGRAREPGAGHRTACPGCKRRRGTRCQVPRSAHAPSASRPPRLRLTRCARAPRRNPRKRQPPSGRAHQGATVHRHRWWRPGHRAEPRPPGPGMHSRTTSRCRSAAPRPARRPRSFPRLRRPHRRDLGAGSREG